MRLLISKHTLHLTYLLILLCYFFSFPVYSQSTNQSSSHFAEQREYVQMSLEHFAEVAELTHQDHQSAQWSNSKINIQFSKTDKQTPSVRIVSIFLVLVFAFIPLAEIVTGFKYNQSSYQSTIKFCAFDYPFEPLSFKQTK